MPELLPSTVVDTGVIVYDLGHEVLRSRVNALQNEIVVPFLMRIPMGCRIVRRILGFPATTNISRGFRSLCGNIFVGAHVTIRDTFFIDFAPIYIFDWVRFGYRNMVIASTHDYANFGIVRASPIVIRRNVWITANVTILPGVEIGENSVIGAGSVVTDSIPENVLAAGNPCRVIKTIERST